MTSVVKRGKKNAQVLSMIEMLSVTEFHCFNLNSERHRTSSSPDDEVQKSPMRDSLRSSFSRLKEEEEEEEARNIHE